MNLHM